jgi:hypothetical protein
MHRTILAALAPATIAALTFTTVVNADVTIELDGFRAGRLEFTQRVAPGQLVGNLTGISVNATITDAKQRTRAEDLCVYLVAPPISVYGALQVGGLTPLINAWNPPITSDDHPMWGSGASGLDGTPVIGTVQLGKPIPMDGSPLAVFVGNGYGSPWSEGTWDGTITLHGVNPPVGTADQDEDGLPDSIDNCPLIANPDQFDCNSNGIGDVCELGDHPDSNEDGWLDRCQYSRGDLDLSRNVDGDDLVVVLSNWGSPKPSSPDPSGNGIFDGDDLVIVLSNWGSTY